ncbi:MAG: Ig-like domain-containing protein [Bacteroidales bacterium]|nr:Ig-like domain-containing protein [Bacteroidales bacterium]
MKTFFTLETLFATGMLLFLLSACNGKDQDLIDSITGKTGVPVTGISLDKASLELKVGDSETLTATVAPEDATNKNVSWASGDATIATVENGRVTGVKPGSVTITAKTEDGGKTAECAVTVKTNLAPSVTVGSEHISAVSVVLQGKANLDSSVPSDLMVGFQYSLSQGILPSNSTTVEATDADAKYNYSTGITGLKPGTTYYFRSIVKMSGNNHYGETMSFTTKPLTSMFETKDATEVGPTSAILNAKLDLTDVQSSGIERGFYWGTTENELNNYLKAMADVASGGSASTDRYSEMEIDWPDKVITSSTKSSEMLGTRGSSLDDNSYSSWLRSLSHKTQYWYKAYLKVDDQEFYGAVKTFTTDVVPVKGVTLDKTACTVHTIDSTFTLTATINPTDATNKAISWKSSNTSVATVDANGTVTAIGNGSATITVTTEDQSKTATCEVTVAQWVTGITLNKTTLALYNGENATIIATILPETANNKELTWTSSNTSIATVSASGVVTAVSGGIATITAMAKDGSMKYASCSVTASQNLSANGSANCYIVSSAGAYSFRTTKGNGSTSVGSVSSAVVLWESYGTSTTPSVGSIINNVSYSSNTITFFTPSTLKNGNAVIAAKDASGNVLWSWHIWVCKDYNPASSAQTYYNNAGTMMDRNLGATSATPGDVGALGLLYQWGRKDPFPGSSSISSNSTTASTRSYFVVSSSSSNGTIAYAVKNPTTFIKGVKGTNYDWVYSSRENTLWKSSKTIYDPCPPGWRVPDGGSNGVWAKAVNNSSSFTYNWNDTKKGMNFSGKFGSAGTIWYPAAGCLRLGDGSLSNVGDGGGWWSCTPNDYGAYYLYLSLNGRVYPSDGSSRALGYSVRCLQE